MAGLSIPGMVVAAGLFAAVGAAAVATRAWLDRRRGVAERVDAGPAPILVHTELEGGVLVKLATPSDPSQLSAQRVFLLQAGFRGGHALEQYLATRSTLALLLPSLGYALLQPDRMLTAMSLLLLLATIGYLAPAVVVNQLRESRKEALRRTVPDMMDMLVGCLEAGLGLDAALRRVTRELSPVAPQLARQLDLVNAELSAGVPRIEALSHLVDRTGLEEIESLVGVLSHAERFGTGIAEAIRAHAQLLRRHRTIEAERKAAEVSPRLTVVMILFIMPAMFIVLVGPAVVQVAERLLPTLAGGR
jgi:tight adherence protein C